MNFFAENIYIIFVIPLIVGLLCLFSYFFKYSFSKKTLSVVTILSDIATIIFSSTVLYYILQNNLQDIESSVNWFKIGDLNFVLGVYSDKLSSLFLISTLLITLAIHYFYFKYVPKDERYNLNLAYLNIFNAAITGLFLSSNIPQTYIFMDIAGVLGYLLLNNSFNNSKISNSAKNFLILNKIGDVLMLVGIIILVYFLSTYPIFEGGNILVYSHFTEIAADFYVYLSDSWFYIACMLLLGGIIAKSAQIPLHISVINVSKGTIPINALLLSCLTGSGIFIAIRLLPLFELSLSVMNTILYVGLLTALFCSFFAISQNNIKKMLAYSSSSYMGLSLAAIGLNIPVVAIIYFLTHAFSKSLLLICSGSLYKLSGEINFNISDFKASRKDYPILAYCYFIGVIALSGLFFGGASANYGMIKACSESMNVSATAIFLLTCFITSYYLFRSYINIFEKTNSQDDTKEYNNYLSIPIIFLTLFVVIISFFPQNFIEFFDKYSDVSKELLSGDLKYVLLYTIIIAGLVVGVFTALKGRKPLPKLLINLSLHGCYIKKLYAIFIDNIFDIFTSLAKNIDKYILTWIFNIFAQITKFISWIISLIQNGNIQSYITYSILLISLSIAGIGIFLVLLRGLI